MIIVPNQIYKYLRDKDKAIIFNGANTRHVVSKGTVTKAKLNIPKPCPLRNIPHLATLFRDKR